MYVCMVSASVAWHHSFITHHWSPDVRTSPTAAAQLQHNNTEIQ